MAKLKLIERQATSEWLMQSAKAALSFAAAAALANRPEAAQLADDALALLKQAQTVAKHPAEVTHESLDKLPHAPHSRRC